MKQTFSKTTKILSAIIAIAVLVFCLPFAGAAGALRAYYDEDKPSFTAPNQSASMFTSTPVSVINGDFAESSGLQYYQQNTNGWTAVQTNSNAVYGTLDTNRFDSFILDDANEMADTDFMQYNPGVRQSAEDTTVLIMANKKQNTTARVGFESSSSITFAPGSYYKVNIDFYAVKGTGAFYLVLDEENKTDNGQDPRIDLHQITYEHNGVVAEDQSIWQTASFFVQTDPLQSISAKLGLYLGDKTQASPGVIYFDSVRITQYSNKEFDKQLTKVYDKTTEIFDTPFAKLVNLGSEYEINKKADEVLPTLIANTKETSGTNVKTNVALGDIPTLLNFEEFGPYGNMTQPTVFPHESTYDEILTDYVNPTVMLLSARDKNASFKTEEPFVINRHQIYMLSFYALSGDMGGYIRIRDERLGIAEKDENYEIPTHLTPYDSGYQNIKLDTSNSAHYNNWVLNTVFIVGDIYDDIRADIEFWVGQKDGMDTDWVALSAPKIQRVSAEYYEKHKDEANSMNLALAEDTGYDVINNPLFNYGTVRSVDAPYPLNATGWTNEADNMDRTLSGIVNTEEDHWAEYDYNPLGSNYGMASNPGSGSIYTENNNIYMMQNRMETNQSLTSNTFPLSTGVYNVITFQTYAIYDTNTGLDGKAIIMTEEGKEVITADLGFAPASGPNKRVFTGWRTHTIAIKDSNITSHQIQIAFTLNTVGVLFLDNVAVDSKTERNPAWQAIADLSDPSKAAAPDGTSLSFSYGNGIFADYDKTYDLLTIKNTKFSFDGIQSSTNHLTETIQAESFYRYTITVAISDLQAMRIIKWDTNDDGVLEDVTDYDEDYEYGINFRLDGFAGGFSNLKSEDLRVMKQPTEANVQDGFTDLVFYIKPDSTLDLSLIIEFGNENMAVIGDVYIRGIKLEEIEKEIFDGKKRDYDKAVKEDNETEYTYMAFATESPYTVDEGTETGGTPKTNPSNYLIASIITAAAVIFALAGFFIRKLRFNWHIKKQHTSYARDSRSVHTARDLKPLKAKKATKPVDKSKPTI